MNKEDRKFKDYLDFDIYYGNNLIDNIMSIEEDIEHYYNMDRCVALIIRYIDSNGKLVYKEYDIDELVFKPKDNTLRISELPSHDNGLCFK